MRNSLLEIAGVATRFLMLFGAFNCFAMYWMQQTWAIPSALPDMTQMLSWLSVLAMVAILVIARHQKTATHKLQEEF